MEQHEQNQKEVVFVKLQRSVQVAWRADLEEGRADHSGHQSVRGGALLSFEQSSDPQRDTEVPTVCGVQGGARSGPLRECWQNGTALNTVATPGMKIEAVVRSKNLHSAQISRTRTLFDTECREYPSGSF